MPSCHINHPSSTLTFTRNNTIAYKRGKYIYIKSCRFDCRWYQRINAFYSSGQCKGFALSRPTANRRWCSATPNKKSYRYLIHLVQQLFAIYEFLVNKNFRVKCVNGLRQYAFLLVIKLSLWMTMHWDIWSGFMDCLQLHICGQTDKCANQLMRTNK